MYNWKHRAIDLCAFHGWPTQIEYFMFRYFLCIRAYPCQISVKMCDKTCVLRVPYTHCMLMRFIEKKKKTLFAIRSNEGITYALIFNEYWMQIFKFIHTWNENRTITMALSAIRKIYWIWIVKIRHIWMWMYKSMRQNTFIQMTIQYMIQPIS